MQARKIILIVGTAATASAGDIPDNQVLLTLHDKAQPFSAKPPEGCAQQTKGNTLAIRDKR
jgi:hypothetical protein